MSAKTKTKYIYKDYKYTELSLILASVKGEAFFKISQLDFPTSNF